MSDLSQQNLPILFPGAYIYNGTVVNRIQPVVIIDLNTGLPAGSVSGNGSITTANPGSTYTTLSSQITSSVTIVNNSGVSLDIQQGGAGSPFTLLNGTSYTFTGIINASQLGVKRTDGSNTPVTVSYRYQS